MNKIERLTNTILLLQERSRTSYELGKALEVSRRTVLRDIEALCAMGVPIIAQGGIGGGYSLAGEYSIRPLQLTWREALLLMLSLSSLSRMSDSPFSEERASLMAKVTCLLPARHREQIESYLEKVEIETPERRRAPMLDNLIEIAGTGSWVDFDYDAPEGHRPICMRPDRVYGDRGFWYVSGLTTQGSKRLRADRIVDIRPTETPPHEEPLEYSHSSHPIVRVALSSRGSRNVEGDPHLGPALAGMKNGVLEFHCPPSELDWYAKYFGSMGEDAVVQGGEELLEKVREWAKRISKLYT